MSREDSDSDSDPKLTAWPPVSLEKKVQRRPVSLQICKLSCPFNSDALCSLSYVVRAHNIVENAAECVLVMSQLIGYMGRTMALLTNDIQLH
jgi:hypothetical protein